MRHAFIILSEIFTVGNWNYRAYINERHRPSFTLTPVNEKFNEDLRADLESRKFTEKWKIGAEVIETKRELAKSEIDEVVRATARQLHGYCERCIKPNLSLLGDRAITIRVDLSNLSNVDVN